MVSIEKRVDLAATFSKMNVGDTVEISAADAPEGRVRATVFRLSKAGKIKLSASVAGASGSTKVTRIS